MEGVKLKMKSKLETFLTQFLISALDLEKFCKDMPNINFPTCGGKVWWKNIYKIDGWKVQKNNVFNNCRILDNHNIRRAWGFSEDYMINQLKLLVNANNNQNS